MRLWHKALIPALPRKQLLSQWRECCCIARNIAVNGTPNHLLVNRIMDYPEEDFWTYGLEVYHEMIRRGYKCDWSRFSKWFPSKYVAVTCNDLFQGWHNDRYLEQCFRNLQEKYDCGGLTDAEYGRLLEAMGQKN